MRRAALARALSWLGPLERLLAASHLASAQGTVCHQPVTSCQVAQKAESSKERKGVWVMNARNCCPHSALQRCCAWQQRAIAHSEFTTATISPLSLITLTTSLLGRYLPLPKAIAQRRFFPLHNLGLKADTARFPPSQIKIISH